MLPSATWPNSSVETTFLILGAKRCSLIASAEPAISRDTSVTNRSSWIGAPSFPGSGCF